MSVINAESFEGLDNYKQISWNPNDLWKINP